MTIRRRVTAQSLSSGYLCERSAGTYTPVNRSASSGSTRGRTPAPIDSQAGGLLIAPDNASLKGKRGGRSAILLYHTLSGKELCKLKVRDF